MRPFYRFAKKLTHVFFRVCGGKVENAHRMHEWQGGILAANHISLLDPPLVGCVFPAEISFLAKRELFGSKLLGPLITALNAIPIRRGTIDRHATVKVQQILERGQSILIFPEGSRRNFTARPGIGKLALQTQVPVLPLYLEHTNDVLGSLFRRRRMRIVAGPPIPVETIASFKDTKEGYRALSEHILHCINALSGIQSDETNE